MIRLLKIEFKKILTYKVFWILLGLYFIFLTLGIFLAEFMINNMINNMNKHFPIPFAHITLYFFPDIWQNLTFFASIRFILIFPAIVIIILITNEFTYKTIRQNIANGMSRNEFLLSKLQIIFLLSVLITLILAASIIILGLSHSDTQDFTGIFRKSAFIFGFFIEIFSFMIFAFFLGFMIRNTGMSIALFVLYTLIIEPVIYFLLKIPSLQPNHISTYLPINTMIRITEYPSIPVLSKTMGFQIQDHVSFLACMIPLIYSAVMIGIVHWSMHKRDL
ncbi:MAG: ABC transporter permease [Bacteroidota bacterium]|nr:ABC transporter permease [Bacteroidota bacterium]